MAVWSIAGYSVTALHIGYSRGPHKVLTRHACSVCSPSGGCTICVPQWMDRTTASTRLCTAPHVRVRHRVLRTLPSTECVQRRTRPCSGLFAWATAPVCACAASGTPAPTNAGDTNPPTRSPTISVLTLAPTFAPTRGPTLSPTFAGGARRAHSMHRAVSLGNRGHACTLGVSAAL